MLSPGEYVASATAIRFVKPKDNIAVEVRFKIKQESGEQFMSWIGYLSEKAMPYTLKTLVEVLEYNGDDEVVSVPEGDATFGMLKNQACINLTKEVKLVIASEPYTDKDGNEKTSTKIKYVNNIGGGQFSGASPEVVKNDLNALGFKAAFLAMKAGKPAAPTAEQTAFTQPGTTSEDVPF